MASTELAPTPLALPTVVVGDHRVRLLRDGPVAFPVMLEAIAGARDEVLLEMYWIGADRVGEQFRAALVERARSGVRVRVIFDAIGSLETPDVWWKPLLDAGAEVQEFSPVSPLKAAFRLGRVANRDHRKVLVVDGRVAFTGGINLGEAWAPPEAPEKAWRDDAIEVAGPVVSTFRAAFYEVWRKCGRSLPDDALVATDDPRIHVLTKSFAGRRTRTIRRSYLLHIRGARRSIDIANAYFLPGPIFFYALRNAARRGVRVRLLVPERSDVLLVALAMSSLYGRLLSDGVEVYAYRPRVLHAKTAVFDDRWTMIGSHNLDSMSSRFNLECNVLVDSSELGAQARASFERDLEDATRLDLETWRSRPLMLRLLAWFVALFRSFL